jgi:hypothetical protein
MTMDRFDEGQSGGEVDDEQSLVQASPQVNQIARTDLMGTSLATSNPATEALIAKERASIEARWIMAMRRPRNLDDVRQRVLAECRRPGFAEAAVYARPVGGGKVAEGLSIRFAEVAMRCMTNMPCDTQTIFDGATERIVRVTVTDLETNVTWSRDITIKKTVERRQLKKGQRPLGERLNSYGERVFIVEATDDEVAVKEAAQISKMARTLILRCVPGNIQDEAKALCRRISSDKTAKDPVGERNKVLDAFSGLGVLPSQLAAYLGKPLEQARPEEIDEFRRLYAAIRDGETSWPEAYAEATDGRTSERKAPTTIVPTSEAPAAAPAPAITPAPATPATPAAPAGPGDLARADRAEAQARQKSTSGTERLKSAIKPPAAVQSEQEVPCADCGVPIMGVAGAGSKCDACRNA